MGHSTETVQLEQELMCLFHETTYRVVKTPCRGKYRGYNDYSLEFGSGRRIFISVGWRNYLPKLRENLDHIQYFRAHQAENTARVKAFLAAHDTPFRDAAVEIVPYDGSNDLTVYAVVILTHQSGVKIRYRTTNLHYVLVSGDNKMDSFDGCWLTCCKTPAEKWLTAKYMTPTHLKKSPPNVPSTGKRRWPDETL